jgi:ankyrin repeat protein
MEKKNNDGDTPLMVAVRAEHANVVDLLCKHGCDIHTHGFDNIEPMQYAINKRNLYMSDVLMKHERQNPHVSTSPGVPPTIYENPVNVSSSNASDSNLTSSIATAINNNAPSPTSRVDVNNNLKPNLSLSSLLQQQQEMHEQQQQQQQQKQSQQQQEQYDSLNTTQENVFHSD